MRQVVKSKILRKFLILVFLCMGLMFVTSSDQISQEVSAAPCCQSCPGFNNPGEEMTYCSDQCDGATSGACYDSCIASVHRCYRTCYYCGGGGGFDECQFDTQCLPGQFCNGGTCS